jgi:hypothetical protein
MAGTVYPAFNRRGKAKFTTLRRTGGCTPLPGAYIPRAATPSWCARQGKEFGDDDHRWRNRARCELVKATQEGPEAVQSADYFKGKRVALFSVPGAFTPPARPATCRAMSTRLPISRPRASTKSPAPRSTIRS